MVKVFKRFRNLLGEETYFGARVSMIVERKWSVFERGELDSFFNTGFNETLIHIFIPWCLSKIFVALVSIKWNVICNSIIYIYIYLFSCAFVKSLACLETTLYSVRIILI